jgi:hypothetical protein
VSLSSYIQAVCSLRFLYTNTLNRQVAVERIPLPRYARKLPIILSREEVKLVLETPKNLGYTHRIAISNRRLISMEDGRVTFEWKDYADGGQAKTMTLEAVEFIRRFLLHVLPSGFVHIRHFGFLANRKRKASLALCRSLLPARQTVAEGASESSSDCGSTPMEQISHQCPVCKIGRMTFIQDRTSAALACLSAPMVANTS